jgi:DNA-binding transcriptional LysR family regulator
MDRLHLMTVFITVVETQGFASAARKLRLSAPAVTRAIAELEIRLGVKLLNRTTRHVRVTDAGQKYYQDAKQIVMLADEAEEAVIGKNAEPKGHITVTASVLFGRLYVMEGIVNYMQGYPEMTVDALFVDRVVNMMEEGIDVAIRIGELPDSSYRAIKVGSVRRVLCASSKYLEQYGYPKQPQDLLNHKVILARGLNPTNEIKFFQGNKSTTVRVNPYLAVSDNDSASQAAIAGLGITRLLSYQVAEPLKNGQLKILLSEHEAPPVPVHIVHREGRYSSARIRSFVDLMTAHLRGQASLN